MTDKYKTITSNPSYEVSENGCVRRCGYTVIYDDGRSERYECEQIKTWIGNGLKFITLDGVTYAVHRLVAETFIDNPGKYKYVKHIDGNKLNNSVNNLCWSKYTSKIDINKFLDSFGTGPGTRIKCLQDGKVFRSIRQAAKYYNVKYSTFNYRFRRNKLIDGKLFVRTSDDPNIFIDSYSTLM